MGLFSKKVDTVNQVVADTQGFLKTFEDLAIRTATLQDGNDVATDNENNSYAEAVKELTETHTGELSRLAQEAVDLDKNADVIGRVLGFFAQ
jgi:hypothetical protein